jgi:hypothetical protein
MDNTFDLKNDLFTMFLDYQAMEFSKWVNSIEEHVSTLKTKPCKSCNEFKLEVISMHKAECQSCQTLNNF